MLAGNGVGHGKLSIPVVLDKGIEAAAVHLCLQDDPGVGNILGVYLQNADMLPVRGCVEQEKSALIEDEVTSTGVSQVPLIKS